MELAAKRDLSEVPAVRDQSLRHQPAYQAYRILHVGFTVAPILAGLDKFLNLLVPWEQYLTPLVPRLSGIPAHTFMMIVGAIEIVAGIGVALKPRIFGYVVAAWLWGIILNLLFVPGFFDVALRDFGLSLGALALARLAIPFDARKV